MARKLRPRKGTTLQNNAYLGALAEVTVDTTKNTIVIHDGTTAGGSPLPTSADLSDAKDVLSFANLAAFPVSGADATVYIAADSGLVYRWNGSAYAPVGLQPIANKTILGNISGVTAAPVALTVAEGQELLGVNFVTQTRTVSAPNATVPAHRLYASAAETDVDLVLSPKGTGALLCHVPDGTANAGNKRGIYAIDLQLVRSAATQVASGDRAICVGSSCTASAPDTISVGEGVASTNTDSLGFGRAIANSGLRGVALGDSITLAGSDAVLVGAVISTNQTQAVQFGRNLTSNTDSMKFGRNLAGLGSLGIHIGDGMSVQRANCIGIGFSSSIASVGAEYKIVMGWDHTVSGGSTHGVMLGRKGHNRQRGGYFTWAHHVVGDTRVWQNTKQQLLGITTDATPKVLTTDRAVLGVTNSYALPVVNTAAKITGRIVALAADACAFFDFTAHIARYTGGNIALIGSATVTLTASDGTGSGWVAAVSVNTTNQCLVVTATGEAGKTIEWDCLLDGIELQ
jgi:hypothetical protein